MKVQLAAGITTFCLAAIGLLASAAASSAAVTCNYSPSSHLLAVSAADSFVRIARSHEALAVDDGHVGIPCSGGAATVQSTDLVQVTHTGPAADILSLAGGPLAPGFSPEPQGLPEIEVQYTTPTFLDIRGTAGRDHLGFGAGGINLNGDGDTDATGQFTVLLVEGRGGNDVIGPQRDYSRAAGRRVLLGGSGNDRLAATPDGSILHGGNGRDRLIGGRGHDNLTGGRGRDVLLGGKGRDLIRALDGTRDRVNCGPGVDRAKVDGIDKVKGCEHLIRVKRRAAAPRH